MRLAFVVIRDGAADNDFCVLVQPGEEEVKDVTANYKFMASFPKLTAPTRNVDLLTIIEKYISKRGDPVNATCENEQPRDSQITNFFLELGLPIFFFIIICLINTQFFDKPFAFIGSASDANDFCAQYFANLVSIDIRMRREPLFDDSGREDANLANDGSSGTCGTRNNESLTGIYLAHSYGPLKRRGIYELLQ